MTFEEFRRHHRPVRVMQPYTPEQRASRAASFRLKHRQRQAVGECFYVIDLVPGRAFPTAKAALLAAYHALETRARVPEHACAIEEAP